MNKTKILLIKINLAILVLASFVSAQTSISTESISIKDGLSSNIVRDITQDEYGYIWIATADGLNIYDGYKISVIKAVPGDSTCLPTNDLYRLLEDKQGTMWISTREGLVKHNRNKNVFTTYRYSDNTADLSNWVINLYEDSHNNLWVSTNDGNVQFDRENEQFVEFDLMLTDNSIRKYVNYGGVTTESSEGDLYNTSQSYGVLKFDYDASLFVQLPLKNKFNDKLKNNRYFDIAADSDNNLWLATTTGLYKIDLDEMTGYDVTPFKRKIVSDSFWDNAVSGLQIDKNQNIWVGTGRKGLYLFNTKQQSFEKLVTLSLSEQAILGFYLDDSGIVWNGTSRGVRKYASDRKPIETYNLSNDIEENASQAVFAFSESNIYKDHVWLGTRSGVHLFNSIKNVVVTDYKEYKKLSHLNEIQIRGIIETKNGLLWISTTGEGLYSYDIRSSKLKNYSHQVYDNSTIKHDQAHTITLDKKENLWIGTHEGLGLLNKNESKIVNIPSFLNRKYEPKLLKKISDLRSDSKPVTSIIKVGDDANLTKEFVLRKDSKILIYSVGEGLPQWNMVDLGWLETTAGDTVWNSSDINESFHTGGGLKNRMTIGLLDLKGGRYKLRYKSDDSHSFESYNQIPPQDSSYWGTQVFSLNDEEYLLYKGLLQNSINRTYLKGEDIQTIYEDSKNNIWVGTDDGASKIDSNLVITNYIVNATDNSSLSNNLVKDIIEDFYGNIWIVTSDGLNKLDPSKNEFNILRDKDGLPTSILSAIEIDENGNLWVSGLKGISKVELDEKGEKQIIVNYDVKDGLQGYEFTNNASFKDKNGKLYFAGVDGFNVFYPGSSNKTAPHLSLQSISISNKTLFDLGERSNQNLEQLSELSLSHNQNDFSFEFASIHFSRPDKNRLLYKMDGVDEEWQVGDRRFASYTNLDPGDYTFNFRGSNGDGVWSEEIRKINIYIASPWYNNWIAYSVYFLIFIGLLLSTRKFEMNRQQKNSKIKESQLKAEAAELKAQAAESQALMVQAENERKSKELEEARQLQLSMLPKELPQLPHLDIAVYMQTATEVGGDYYDFHVALDGTLTVVVGDATGHGMKAGTMVTTAKSLFNSYAPNPDILFSFKEITRCIKQMNFGKLSMCMTMLKIKGEKMQISTAGMPPSFIFRRDTRVVEEHLFKAMPLGTMEKFPYEIKDTTLNPGDTILLLSDGLPELKNANEEMYGYKRIRNGFEDVAEKAPEEIVSYLKNEGAGWVDNADPDDDVTFVVIKVKETPA